MYEGKLLRDKLKARKICLGIFNTSSDPCIAELLSGSGYDFMIIDAEHGALNIETIQANIMAAKGTDTVPLVRVPANDDIFIKRVLDAGAGGVLVPQVRSRQDVQRAVRACLYPPDGFRGFGPRRPANYERNYPEVVESANDHIVVWVQIEHLEAIEQIEEIVQTPRLDGVIIGPGDLSASIGVIFQKRHPKVLEAIEKVKAAAQRAGVPAGMAGLTDAQDAIEWIREGFQFATLGTSNGLLMRASRDFIASVTQGIEERS